MKKKDNSKSKSPKASQLTDILWDTLGKVKSGKLDCVTANSIASQGRVILQTINTQTRVAKQTGRDVPPGVLDFTEQ